MKLILFFILSCNIYALDEVSINDLIAQRHNDGELLDELKIFPLAREFNVVVSTKYPEKGGPYDPVVRKCKVVEGKYIVNETNIEADRVNLNYVHVVTFDKEIDGYKMWLKFTLTIEGEEPTVLVDEFDGIYFEEKRVLSWVQVPNLKRPGYSSSSLVILKDESEEWTSYSYEKGKL